MITVLVLAVFTALAVDLERQRRQARAARWAGDEAAAESFIRELRAVQPGELIRASVAPPRTPPARVRLRSVPFDLVTRDGVR